MEEATGSELQSADHRFEEEVLPYLDELYGSALVLTRNKSDAEDLVQEVFLKAYTGFDSFEPGTNARAWIYRIMTNTYVSTYRKSARDLQHIGQPLPQDWQLQDAGTPSQTDERSGVEGAVSGAYSPSAETEAMLHLEADEAYALLDSLPEAQRTTVYLMDVMGLTAREVAEIMEVPQNTVLSRARRGRLRLREAAQRPPMSPLAAVAPKQGGEESA